MKIDFDMLWRMEKAGASAGSIIIMLQAVHHAQEPRRERDRARKAKETATNGAEPSTVVAEPGRKPQPKPLEDSPRARLFREGAATIMALGRTERAARGMIAGWLKATDNNETLVADTIARAGREAVADACGWITATLKARTRNGHGNETMDAFDRLTDRAASFGIAGDPPMRDINPKGD